MRIGPSQDFALNLIAKLSRSKQMNNNTRIDVNQKEMHRALLELGIRENSYTLLEVLPNQIITGWLGLAPQDG